MRLETATVAALCVSGGYLSGTERRPNEEGSMCFTYKYSYVLTPNTTHNALWLLSLLLTLPSTNTYLHGTNIWISDKVVSSEHTANINSFMLRESPVARRNVQLCLSSCLLSSSSSGGSSLRAGKLASPVFFCLIWSQEWLSKKERDSQCGRGWRCGLLFLAEEV